MSSSPITHYPDTLGQRQLIIHVGFPKALSTWLQRQLFLKKCGFLPVMNSFTVQIALINPSPFHFSANDCYRFIQEKLDKDDPEGKKVHVISAENLSGNLYCGGFNAKQNIDRIKEAFPEAKILFFTREQRSLIRSLYKTQVLWGSPYSIKQLLNPTHTSLAPQFNLDFLRFDKRVAYYQELFGKDNVLTLPYEYFVEQPLDFIERVAQFCHLSEAERKVIATLNFSKKINTNIPLLQIEIQRWLNRFLYKSPFNYNALISQSDQDLLDRLKRHKKSMVPNFAQNTLENSFKRIVAEHTQGAFTESNATLAKLMKIDLAKYHYELP